MMVSLSDTLDEKVEQIDRILEDREKLNTLPPRLQHLLTLADKKLAQQNKETIYEATKEMNSAGSKLKR